MNQRMGWFALATNLEKHKNDIAQCFVKHDHHHHHHRMKDQDLNQIDDIAFFVAFCKMSQTSSVALD